MSYKFYFAPLAPRAEHGVQHRATNRKHDPAACNGGRSRRSDPSSARTMRTPAKDRKQTIPPLSGKLNLHRLRRASGTARGIEQKVDLRFSVRAARLSPVDTLTQGHIRAPHGVSACGARIKPRCGSPQKCLLLFNNYIIIPCFSRYITEHIIPLDAICRTNRACAYAYARREAWQHTPPYPARRSAAKRVRRAMSR